MALAIDHRPQFEELAAQHGAGAAEIGAFKVLAVQAAARVAAGRDGFGMLIDGRLGRDAIFEFARHPFAWLGRPVEQPVSRPLRFEHGADMGSELVEWPVDHCAKVLCRYRPDDPPALKQRQGSKLATLFEASRRVGRELLVEIVAGKVGEVDEDIIPRALAELYGRGIKPDWWKLEPQATPEGWRRIGAVIEANDPWCRGVLMLGLDAPMDDLEASLEIAAQAPVVKGFAVGRTIFREAAESWFAGRLDNEAAMAMMAERFDRLSRAWLAARPT
jgi:5-dehydro-2-deoxygluconokinase